MATLATFFRRSDAVAAGAERSAAIRAESDPFRLRALPNDDIYFFSKRIDNSRVVRQQDPSAGGECWSAVGAAAVVLVLGASVIAPHVGSVLAGYKLEALKQDARHCSTSGATLKYAKPLCSAHTGCTNWRRLVT